VILVDTSVWIDHFRTANDRLIASLTTAHVLSHPFIIGELVIGNLNLHHPIVEDMRDMPQSMLASHDEVLTFIDRHNLYRLGLSFVDAHLLAATQLTPDARLWTLDRRLLAGAQKLGLAA